MDLREAASLVLDQFLDEGRKYVYRVDAPETQIDPHNLQPYEIGPKGSSPIERGQPAAKGTMLAHGLFAADRAQAAMYARPRAGSENPTNCVSHVDAKGRRVVTFHSADREHIMNHQAIERAYPAERFRALKSGERVSRNPGEPVRTRVIKNPLKHMQSTGLIVQFTDDLDKHAQELRKAGITAWVNTEK